MEVIYNCRKECCPTMVYDNEEDLLIIKDDFGSSVKLTPSQFNELQKAFSDKFKMITKNA